MKKLVTALTLIAVTASALPAAAGSTKVHEFKDGPLAGEVLKYKQWPNHKCDTYIANTRFKNLTFVNKCIDQVSKSEYAQAYAKFTVDYEGADDDRVNMVRKKGLLALAHPDIKWEKESRQTHLKNGKIAAISIGSILAATGLAAISAGGLVTLLMNMPGYFVWFTV